MVFFFYCQASKQNITRDIEIKNKLTVTRGEREGITRVEKEEVSSRNRYKGHMDKAKGGRFKGGRWGWVGRGAWWGENGDNCT